MASVTGASDAALLLLPAPVTRMLGGLVEVGEDDFSAVALASAVRRARTMRSRSIHSLTFSARSASFWSWEEAWLRRPVRASPVSSCQRAALFILWITKGNRRYGLKSDAKTESEGNELEHCREGETTYYPQEADRY